MPERVIELDKEIEEFLNMRKEVIHEWDLRERFPNIRCVGHLGDVDEYFERLWLWENDTHRVITHDLGNGYCTIVAVFPKMGKMDRRVILPKLLECDDAIVYIWEEERKHIAWMTTDGKVISFEYVLGNSGDPSLSVWDSLDDYIEAIKDVDWIVDGVGREFEKCLRDYGLEEKWERIIKEFEESCEVVE